MNWDKELNSLGEAHMKLLAENERLRAALQRIAGFAQDDEPDDADTCAKIARAALEQKIDEPK